MIRFLLGILFCLHFSLAYAKPVVLDDPAPIATSSILVANVAQTNHDHLLPLAADAQTCCAETSKSLKQIGLCQMGDLPLPFFSHWNVGGSGTASPILSVNRPFQAVDVNDLFRPPIL